MANFTRVRSAGMWTVSVLLGSELEKFDANLFKAPNFEDGGTYAPSAAVIVGGAGITLTGNLNVAASFFSGTARFNGDVHLGDTSGDAIRCDGTWACYGPATFANTVGIQGAVNCTGNVTLGNNSSDALLVNATSTFVAPVTTANATLGGSASNETLVTSKLVLGTETDALSGDITVDATRANFLEFTMGGAARNVTLGSSGFTSGTIKIIINADATYNCVVRDAAYSTTLATLTPGQAGIFIYSVDMWRKVLAG